MRSASPSITFARKFVFESPTNLVSIGIFCFAISVAEVWLLSAPVKKITKTLIKTEKAQDRVMFAFRLCFTRKHVT